MERYMQQILATGYIKKTKKLKDNKHLMQKLIQYEGKLKIQNKEIVIQIFSEDENLKQKEIYVKLSHNIADNIYGML
jgi:predicted Mrr-cat superfamily restriction endonuclease